MRYVRVVHGETVWGMVRSGLVRHVRWGVARSGKEGFGKARSGMVRNYKTKGE